MTDRIAHAIVEALSPIIPTYLAEAETEGYPYAVYSYEPTWSYTKDGAYKITADDVTVTLVGKDFDDLHERQQTAIEALQAITGERFSCRLKSTATSRTEAVWELTTYFRIIQKF